MKKLVVFALAVWGAYWYAAHRLNLSDTMNYAKKNAVKPWASTVVYSVGLLYYQRGDYAKSQETFNSLLTDYPTGQYTARALLRLSEVSEVNHDYPVAKETLDRFLGDFPDHPDRMLAIKRRELLYNK
jgi:outer membrane protein assembly factor BamD (BamD/ComL family)